MTTNPPASLHGSFVRDDDGETWYRIDGIDDAAPFFTVITGDNDLWAFVSSAGSLAAGRQDAESSFLPYETVDKIHSRWEHTGPRTWIQVAGANGAQHLWTPFSPRLDGRGGPRSLWKNLSSTRLRFQEDNAELGLRFAYEWFTTAEFGLVRSVRLTALSDHQPVSVRVLDGVLNLVPPGVGVTLNSMMSCLADAYKWNESLANGRLGLYTLYAQIWDRAEPKESFQALVAWHVGLPEGARTLLSAEQVQAFCRGAKVQPETLTRGRPGACLAQFDAQVTASGLSWHQVIDGPCSQVAVDALARRLAAGGGTADELVAARQSNTAGLDDLLARADGLQESGDPMAAAHHRANVLFNIMRGGVFVDGTRLQRDDLIAFARQRNKRFGQALADVAASWPETVERDHALRAAAALGPQAERLVLAYLPLTFSRRHGDPSRPWNKFSVRVRDSKGQRVLSHQGNWRDIFQNWEALVPSEPAWVGSMVSTFLSAMTADGYNPYRIGRDGIDWEAIEPDDPWSYIGYWGDHQIIYLLRLMEAAQAQEPGLLGTLWNRQLFSFADVPYRLRPHAEQVRNPKETIDFDLAAHERAHERRKALGGDGLLILDDAGEPVLATLGEKLATILLAKAGSLVPGGGLWLHTQRPEWNDANNALAGYGLSVVTLAYLRRFLAWIAAWPQAAEPFAVSQATLEALQGFQALLAATPADAADDDTARRRFLDEAGALLDPWRAAAYAGAAGRVPAVAPAGLMPALATQLLPMVDATLQRCRRPDGLFDTYNLVAFSEGTATVSRLYPMLEGQVAALSAGLLSPSDAASLLDTLFASALHTADRDSFLLYPDRTLPGFLARNRLDEAALALPVVQRLLAQERTDVLQTQPDGTVRFAPQLTSRDELASAAADVGEDLPGLLATYERVLGHHAFTGRSGTMFGYEGLGCIYWHMVAKLLLAVQEQVFAAADADDPALPRLCKHYRRVRDGLGYKRGAAAFGAFPLDPYSHTPGEGGARQPGMTGQVKEEILTRWGELGLRMKAGVAHVDPVLLDAAELPEDGALRFTWRRIPCTWRRGPITRVRVRRDIGWTDCPDGRFDPQGVLEIEADLAIAESRP
jgi:hypothetical protein